jgi:hypothetical protein
MFNLLHVFETVPGAGDGEAGRIADALTKAGRRLPGVRSSVAGPTLPRALNGGSLMWRIAFASEVDYWTALASARWRESIAPLLAATQVTTLDRIAYWSGLSDTSVEQTRPGIWRCLALSVDAGTPSDLIRQFERDITLMPEHVSTIRNWSLGHVVVREGRRHWTHVWEQEFDDLAGLEGEYMMHPIHWGLVDGWFDPECPQRIVDPLLIHAAFDIGEPVIL